LSRRVATSKRAASGAGAVASTLSRNDAAVARRWVDRSSGNRPLGGLLPCLALRSPAMGFASSGTGTGGPPLDPFPSRGAELVGSLGPSTGPNPPGGASCLVGWQPVSGQPPPEPEPSPPPWPATAPRGAGWIGFVGAKGPPGLPGSDCLSLRPRGAGWTGFVGGGGLSGFDCLALRLRGAGGIGFVGTGPPDEPPPSPLSLRTGLPDPAPPPVVPSPSVTG